ncbi:hypothetical protein ACN28C_22390 [Plantactinospora sp. WMMC1484]|uniref:hypothetical protein n=1 Tax=Plantactinospora sp. WMMC1484 TaxID=3404122 RepID=UPI003BF479C7
MKVTIGPPGAGAANRSLRVLRATVATAASALVMVGGTAVATAAPVGVPPSGVGGTVAGWGSDSSG